ncbi:MAG TPA: hypothetical protein VJ508_05835, partial [Saprospiraceae bacterium]|nr:hypothetical protein [Saprospiraceae bacterium]
APDIALGGVPPGGTWTGMGVSGNQMTGYVFDPSVGTQTLTYTVADGNNCTNSATTMITVNPLPMVTCPAGFSTCVNTDPFALTGGMPGGGDYSGDGVVFNLFNPGLAGIGPHTITYTVTDGNMCTNTCTFVITVNALPILACPPNGFEVCLNFGLYNLLSLGITPAGGNFTGAGVMGNTFDPVAAGVGTHPITYAYTDPMTNCTSSCTFNALVDGLPMVTCPANSNTCINTPPYALTGGIPNNGTYSGPGVSMNTFDPSIAGTGVKTITYTVTDGNSCSSSCTFTITVNALPTVTCPLNSSTCITTPPYALTGGMPLGGTYSGLGVSMNLFFPAIAGPGPHLITYTYTDPMTNCTNSCTFTITVDVVPVVTCPGNSTVCELQPPFALVGGMPSGGTYSGVGVSMNMFNPSVAGPGPHTITYTYTTTGGCMASCTFVITVAPANTCGSLMTWVFMPPGQNGSCVSQSNCCSNILCYGLQYTPGTTGNLESYTTGFFVDCIGGTLPPITYNQSCVMDDVSDEFDVCASLQKEFFNSSGQNGFVPVTATVPIILHQVCFNVPDNTTLTITEDVTTDLTTSIDVSGNNVTENPFFAPFNVSHAPLMNPMDGSSTVQCIEDA